MYALHFGIEIYACVFVEEINTCLERNLYKLRWERDNMDSNIIHFPPLTDEQTFLPYVGNGYIGAAVHDEASIRIKAKVNSPLYYYLSTVREALNHFKMTRLYQ